MKKLIAVVLMSVALSGCVSMQERVQACQAETGASADACLVSESNKDIAAQQAAAQYLQNYQQQQMQQQMINQMNRPINTTCTNMTGMFLNCTTM